MVRRVPTLPAARPARRAAGAAALGAAGLCVAALAVAAVVAGRVVVEGDSMEPTLRAGDRIFVVRLPARLAAAVLRPGQLVAAPDPRRPDRLLVKRVASVAPGGVELAGDHAARSTDSRAFGPVPPGSVRGIAVYRYAPAGRAGRLRGGSVPAVGPSVR